MNIGLVDIDKTRFPNLVLMKLSAWHKSKENNVSLLTVNDVLNGDISRYDALYGACTFTKNRTKAETLKAYGVHVAGSGVDYSSTAEKLPDHIEHIMPDYSLYGITDTAYGFLTRGCPRGCPFCIVAEKEGKKSIKVANLQEWWSGQKYIKLLDPNLLASDEHIDLLKQLANSKAYIDITQGADIRLLTDENIEYINALKLKQIHFAWDNPKDEKTKSNLEKFAKNRRYKSYVTYPVYVLTNYWSSFEEDLYRVYWLRDHGYNPYIMIYDKENAPKQVRQLQRWVNNRMIFRSCSSFEEYDANR